MSHLESLLLKPVPAPASGRHTSAGPPADSAPTKHAKHGPPVAPPVSQAPVAFYESALNPGDDEWTDDEDLGYRRVPSTEEALWSCVASPHRPPPAPPDGASSPAASSAAAPPPQPTSRDKPGRDKAERDSRSSPLEIFPNLNARPLGERDLGSVAGGAARAEWPTAHGAPPSRGRAPTGGLDRPTPPAAEPCKTLHRSIPTAEPQRIQPRKPRK